MQCTKHILNAVKFNVEKAKFAQGCINTIEGEGTGEVRGGGEGEGYCIGLIYSSQTCSACSQRP